MTTPIPAQPPISRNIQPTFRTVTLAVLPLLGLLLPILGYFILPMFGVDGFSEAFGFTRLLLLCGAIIGGALYWAYIRVVLSKPHLLVGFILLAWPLVVFFNTGLLEAGLNIHLRPLLILSVSLPGLWLGIRHYRQLSSTLPWFNYYLLFFGWMVLYFIIFNANAVDPRLSGGGHALSEGSVSLVQLNAYLDCLVAIAVTGLTMLNVRDYKQLFDRFNQGLLWVSGIESLITIAGYPFGLFSLPLDGFTRAIGIFSHPNPFSHHMGILLVYLLGLFCYYQGERKNRLPGWLSYGGILVNFIALLLGLSKTALGVFALSAIVIGLMNLSVPTVRRYLMKLLLGLLLVVPVGLVVFSAVSGHSFVDLLESRIDHTQSFDWRTMVWQDLIADITPVSIWLGHGFTAANDVVFRMTFNDTNNANPLMMVHNAYIALLYDFGLPGYLFFAAALSLFLQAARGWIRAVQPLFRVEYSIMIGLTVYFLCVCGLDEMSYMFDAPMLFWTLATLLYCLSWRERREHRTQAITPPPMGVFPT